MSENFNQLVSVPRAAKLIGMSASWLRKEIDDGRVPAFRPKCHLRVRVGDVTRLLAKSQENGAPRVLVLDDDPLKD